VKATLWIAADLARETMATPALRVIAPLLMTIMPAYHGMLDGWIGADANPMRLWLSGSAIMPSVLLAGFFADIVMPRVLGAEMEPLLAAPVRDREIVAAHMLPLAACQVVYLIAGIPLTMAAYRLASGTFPEHVLREAAYLALGSTAASLLVAAGMARALMTCRSVGSFLLRSFVPLAGVALLDVVCWLLRWNGRHAWAIVLLAGALLAACAAAWRAGGALERERLIARR